MNTKFLDYLHSKLDSLISSDYHNINDIQKKARYLAQYRYQDCNYNQYARSYLLDAVCAYDAFLIKSLHDYIKSLIGD